MRPGTRPGQAATPDLPQDDAERKQALKLRESSGTLYFDNRTGHVVEMRMPLDMDIDINADGMQLKMGMDMKVTMKLQKGSK